MARRFLHAPLAFIRSALCPLDFHATQLGEHPAFREVINGDDALAAIEVGESLRYATQFPYVDHHRHRRVGTQIVTAPFGLAPIDVDLLFALFTYLRGSDEFAGGEVHLTADFIGRLAGLPTTCPDDYQRIRSRLFRLSYVKYTNSAAWNSVSQQYDDISNFEFFSIKSMSRLTESRRPIVLQLSRELVSLLKTTPVLAFDNQLMRSLQPAMRRFYLLANCYGWKDRHSPVFAADDFAVHQLGYARDPNVQRDRIRRKDRLHKLRRLVRKAEQLGIVRPYAPWNDYFTVPKSGRFAGQLALRWSRGPTLHTKEMRSTAGGALEDDALFAQLQQLPDEHGKPLSTPHYRRLLADHGRARLQKHVTIVLTQKEVHPQSFKRSPLATALDRIKHDYAAPDWFAQTDRSNTLSDLGKITPNTAANRLYEAISRST